MLSVFCLIVHTLVLSSHIFFSQSPPWSTKQPLFTQNPLSSGAMLPERFGERVLYQTKEERELKERLEAIEEQLGRFKAHEAQVR